MLKYKLDCLDVEFLFNDSFICVCYFQSNCKWIDYINIGSEASNYNIPNI